MTTFFTGWTQAERARKNAESELSETTHRVGELSSMMTSLTADRRRFDADMAGARADLEDATREKTEADERAAKLQACHVSCFNPLTPTDAIWVQL